MKINIELDSNLKEIELVIKTPDLNSDVILIKELVEKAIVNSQKIVFYKGDSEYFIPLESILFFETDDNKVYAHTTDEFFEVKFKLYELEQLIPFYYCRISKSSIINTKAIYSLEKSFSGSSTASFSNSKKQVHISRHYYKILKDKLKEMRRSFIGLFFIILAVTTLLDGFSIFPNGSIFLAICTVVLGFFAIRGLMDFDSFGTIFPLALLFYVYNKNYHFADISGGKIFFIAVFLSLGISMFVPRKYKYREFKSFYKVKKHQKIKNGNDFSDVTFGENVQYVDITKSDSFSASTTFGTTTIYFEKLDTYPIKNFDLNVSISFGNLKVYVPKEWAIENNTNNFLGKVQKHSHSIGKDVKIILNGSVTFGEVEIIHV